MKAISINELKAARKELADSGELESLKKKVKKGSVSPDKAILFARPAKGEVARILVGGHLFVVFYDETSSQHCLRMSMLESNIPTSNVRTASNRILGHCSEIIESEGEWFFTKYGDQDESYPLGLSDDDVDKLATFLGFAPKRGGRYRFTYSPCGFSKMLSEWAEQNKGLAKELNNGDYTNGILAA